MNTQVTHEFPSIKIVDGQELFEEELGGPSEPSSIISNELTRKNRGKKDGARDRQKKKDG